MEISQEQINLVNNRIHALVKAESFYGKKLEEAGLNLSVIDGSEPPMREEPISHSHLTQPTNDRVRIEDWGHGVTRKNTQSKNEN